MGETIEGFQVRYEHHLARRLRDAERYADRARDAVRRRDLKIGRLEANARAIEAEVHNLAAYLLGRPRTHQHPAAVRLSLSRLLEHARRR